LSGPVKWPRGTCPRGDMSRGKCPIHSDGLSRTSYSLSYMYIANHDVMVASVIDPREKKPFLAVTNLKFYR